jgi:hypothetical protein
MTTDKDRAEFERELDKIWPAVDHSGMATDPTQSTRPLFCGLDMLRLWQAARSRSGAVPAVTDAMVHAACAAHDSVGWAMASGETLVDMQHWMRKALNAAFAAAPEPPQGDPRDSGCLCSGCGTRYRGDLLVPDDVWERIKPAGSSAGGGLLCPNCIMQRVVDLGVWTAARATDIEAPRSGDAPVAYQLRCNGSRWMECSRDTFERGRCDVAGHVCEVRALYTAPPADAPESLGWQVVEVKNEGEYGDGGPDSRTGFTSYAIADSEGRILFDSLNCDHRVCEVHEEFDDEDGYRTAWDESSRKRAEMIVARMNSSPKPPGKSTAELEGERIDRSLAEWDARFAHWISPPADARDAPLCDGVTPHVRARTLLTGLWQKYDAGGISMGRSHEAVLLETAMDLLDDLRDSNDVRRLNEGYGDVVDASRNYLSDCRARREGLPPADRAMGGE